MLDKRVLEIARKSGYDCYLDQKPLEPNIPWGHSEENLPYRNQMIASYNEAKALFEGENKENKKKS